MAGYREVFTDHAEDSMEIRYSPTYPSAAVIDFENNASGTVIIPAHRLAIVVADLYQAAGQPVPELPHIPDPVQHIELAKAVIGARRRHAGPFGDVTYQEREQELARLMAADLLAAGWTKVTQ